MPVSTIPAVEERMDVVPNVTVWSIPQNSFAGEVPVSGLFCHCGMVAELARMQKKRISPRLHDLSGCSLGLKVYNMLLIEARSAETVGTISLRSYRALIHVAYGLDSGCSTQMLFLYLKL